MFYFDLDEMDKLANKLFFFGLNKINLYSFRDSDHFKFVNNYHGEADIISKEKIKYQADKYKNKTTKERIGIMIEELGLNFEPDKVYLLTNVRTFGYVFNPVSFYYCFDKAGQLRALFSEVNNTYLQQKMYYSVIKDPNEEVYKEKQRKNYYISPFIDYDTDLEWTFSTPGEKLKMQIDSVKGDNAVLTTNLIGSRRELTNINLLYLFLRYPFYNFMVIIIIHFQALKLWFKKVPLHGKKETDKKIAQTISSNKER
jgi:DUF1365 family protein